MGRAAEYAKKGYAFGYVKPAVASYAAPVTTYAAHMPYTYAGVHHLGKREAEADSPIRLQRWSIRQRIQRICSPKGLQRSLQHRSFPSSLQRSLQRSIQRSLQRTLQHLRWSPPSWQA